MGDFLKFEDQIKRLKNDRKLIITNENKLKNYLKNYGYEIIINSHINNLFYGKDKIFHKGITSCSLINVFELDRSISFHLLKRILEIERRIATSIVYNIPLWFIDDSKGETIPEEIKKEIIDKLKKGHILKLSDNEWDIVFSNIKSQKDKDKKLSKKDLIKYLDNKDIESETNKDIPIWELSKIWTFRTLTLIFIGLSSNIRNKVKLDLFPNRNITNSELISVMELLNDLRNKICHNNTIYTFSKGYYGIKFRKLLKRKMNNFHINDAIDIINLFDLDKEVSLENKIKDEIKIFETKMNEICISEENLEISYNEIKERNTKIVNIIKHYILNQKNH